MCEDLYVRIGTRGADRDALRTPSNGSGYVKVRRLRNAPPRVDGPARGRLRRIGRRNGRGIQKRGVKQRDLRGGSALTLEIQLEIRTDEPVSGRRTGLKAS